MNYWENRNLAGNNDYQITLLNIDLEESLYSNIKTIKGMNLNPINNNWKLTNNTSINYIVSLSRY